jgi:hypothetical protein
MFASYTSHFTKSAHSFNVAFQDGEVLNEGYSRGRAGPQNHSAEDEEVDEGDAEEEEEEEDGERDPKRKTRKKHAAPTQSSARTNTAKPANQAIYDKFLLAENALKKFEQNFNHHSQVHVDMVTVEFLPLLSLSLSLSLSLVIWMVD